MANNKIVDREGLKAFRQANDTRYENGIVVVGKSLTAKQLEPISEDAGSIQTAPFLFQGTGTNDNTTSTPTSPIAKHLELRGNSVVFNQQGANGNKSAYNVDITFDNQTGVCSCSGTPISSTIEVTLGRKIVDAVGHKILIKANILTNPNSISVKPRAFNDNNGDAGVYGTTGILSFIFTSSSDTGSYYGFQLESNVSTNGLTFTYQVFDLTAIYGAGNEPTSYLQFVRDYPLSYYAYNEGTLKSCKSSKLVTIGCNQFDGTFNTIGAYKESDYIRVISGQTYALSQTETGFNAKVINQFDYNKNQIKTSYLSTSQTESTLTLEDNCCYVKITYDYTGQTYSTPTNVMFRLYWNETHDYVDYDKHEYDLPSVELRSVGIVYDTITPNGVYTQRIGVRAYQSGDESDTNVITDLTNTYYVLETPIISEVGAFAENIIVDDFGTMEFVQSVDNVEPIIPQGNKFFYPADYVLFLDDLYNVSKDGGDDADANNLVTQSELPQTWYGTQAEYDILGTYDSNTTYYILES